MRHVSDKRVSIKRTICEVHREIYDLFENNIDNDHLFNLLVSKLNEAYIFGKEMDKMLREFKYGYDKDMWPDNPNYKKSFELRKGKK